jgi:diaminohydroxyphosphoribosylaminopyrimidine deaminase/5-amino-6-(5-phosphoribosylamino)uracil reductase
MTIQTDKYMRKAIELARQGLGRTAPNPAVGAVLVRDGNVVGEGFHPAAGQPHAEIFALRAAADNAKGADLYVTLEPCCHQGRTGPCADAIIAAGVSRVFVGTSDPNPLVSGKGIERLLGAGIEVVTDVLNHECCQLIAPFSKHVTTGLPYVVLKSAMTLDGQTATLSGDSKWISCEASRTLVHQLRNQVDAIMVGSGTVIADNPRLTTRLNEGGRDPVRVVMDGRLQTSPDALVYTQSSAAQTILVTSEKHTDKDLRPYRDAGAQVVLVSQTAGELSLLTTLQELANRNLHYILLEGGSLLGGAMLRAGLVDRLMLFVAPKILGGQGRGLLAGSGAKTMADAFALKHLNARKVDTDILLEGEVLDVYRPD